MSVALDIKNCLFGIVESNLSPTAPPNINSKGAVPFFEYFIIPAPVVPLTVASTDEHSGVFQINVNYSKGLGEIKATEMADLALALFPRNTQISWEDKIVIKFDRSGSIGPMISQGDRVIMPVSFQYLILTKEV